MKRVNRGMAEDAAGWGVYSATEWAAVRFVVVYWRGDRKLWTTVHHCGHAHHTRAGALACACRFREPTQGRLGVAYSNGSGEVVLPLYDELGGRFPSAEHGAVLCRVEDLEEV